MRVSFPYANLVEMVKKLPEVCDKVVVYQHDASRTHVHMLLRECKVSTDTLKNWIKKALNVSVKKTDWSFKSADKDDKYITYMSKGTLDPVFAHGYDSLGLAALRNKWVNANASISEDSRNVRTVRVTNYTIAAQAYAKYLEGSKEEELALMEGKVNMKRLVNIVKEICKENKKGCNYDNVAKIVQTVLADLSPAYWMEKVLARL